jgi:hypothetical protein
LAVSFLVPRPLGVLFFFLLHRAGYLLPDLEGCVMSEPLALAMFYLVVAVFCVIVARRSLWPLPLLAAAFGALVLTRSAGAFAIIIFAAGVILVATTNWRRTRALTGALALTSIVGLGAFAALLGNSHSRNGVWTLTPLKNWERVAFALEIADLADIDAMPDADTRQFLHAALQDGLNLPGTHNEFDLNKNCWGIAYPTAHRMFVERFGTADLPEPGEFSRPLFRYVNGLFCRVADTVLPLHRDRYCRIVAHSFLTRATRDCTRLHRGRVTFWWLISLGILACLLGRNRCSLAGATCLAAHLGNLMIMSCFELPLDRYVYFSEWVCLLGLLLACVGCGERWTAQKARNREGSSNDFRLAA